VSQDIYWVYNLNKPIQKHKASILILRDSHFHNLPLHVLANVHDITYFGLCLLFTV
jgi:hypothetical protein